MWQNLILAGIGGTLTGLAIWQTLIGAGRRFSNDHAHRRLQKFRERVNPAQRAHLVTRELRYSYLPAFREVLLRFSIAPRILLFLEQADSNMNVSSYVLMHACYLTAGSLIAWFLHLPSPTAIAVTLGSGVTPWIILTSRRRKRFSQLSEQLTEATHMIASAMRAGLSLEAGMDMVALEAPDPIRGEFRKFVNEWRLYSDMTVAFRNLATRVPLADFQLLAACVRLHREVGGNFAPLLHQLGSTIRERFQLQREMKTLTAESRFSGVILGILPLIVGTGLLLINPLYFRSLLEHPAGRHVLWLAIMLQLIGFGVIRWLTTPRIR
ncbi:MAG: type II secretion system F family protein [Candidatus Omnitrophica bacterium]|nr:type II secretion system F family protein [Candidatus Omnitrophota bacterium]